MPSSKRQILSAIRQQQVPAAELPPVFSAGIVYADPVAQFREMLSLVGGRLIIAESAAEAAAELQQLPPVQAARMICSAFPDLCPPTVDLNNVPSPHALESVDLAILPGEFAVAENAAVWFLGARTKYRVLPFITQHLVLVVPAGQIVNNMHEAYERVRITGAMFGTFISGPSKTADIEQSLVIGAHGARSLTVIFMPPAG